MFEKQPSLQAILFQLVPTPLLTLQSCRMKSFKAIFPFGRVKIRMSMSIDRMVLVEDLTNFPLV